MIKCLLSTYCFPAVLCSRASFRLSVRQVVFRVILRSSTLRCFTHCPIWAHNTDIVRIAAALGPCGVIGHELQVYFVKVEGVIPDLYETSLRILADDLPPVVLWRRLVVIFHANHPLQAVGCYLRPQSRSLQNPHQISPPELPCTI